MNTEKVERKDEYQKVREKEGVKKERELASEDR
jgi:hypothetical protein